MDKLAADYADDVHFVFVYVREAHPDEFPDHPAHKSFEQKVQHAEDMRDRHGTPRRIAVDALDGDVHRLYGGMPNMSWVLDHTGRITYKAAWTVEGDIRNAVEQVLQIREMKREGRFKDYYRETMWVIPSGRDASGNPTEERLAWMSSMK